MAREELTDDVKQAVAIAREALEVDASEARKRGWGIPTPDSEAVATLAAGILIAGSIDDATEPAKSAAAAASPSVNRRRSSRTAA
jgi:hypothetical protein